MMANAKQTHGVCLCVCVWSHNALFLFFMPYESSLNIYIMVPSFVFLELGEGQP